MGQVLKEFLDTLDAKDRDGALWLINGHRNKWLATSMDIIKITADQLPDVTLSEFRDACLSYELWSYRFHPVHVKYEEWAGHSGAKYIMRFPDEKKPILRQLMRSDEAPIAEAESYLRRAGRWLRWHFYDRHA